VTTAITFTGLNYIEPARLEEIGLTTFFIFATVFVIGFLIGEISQVLASDMASKIHYQHELTVLQVNTQIQSGYSTFFCKHLIHEMIFIF